MVEFFVNVLGVLSLVYGYFHSPLTLKFRTWADLSEHPLAAYCLGRVPVVLVAALVVACLPSAVVMGLAVCLLVLMLR